MTPRAGRRNLVRAGDFTGVWEDLTDLDLPDVAAVFCTTHLDAIRVAWHAACDTNGEVLIAAASREDPDLVASLLEDGFAVVRLAGGDVRVTHPDANADRAAEPGRVWLLTSGSTGRPKRVAHTLASLTTVGGDQPARTWLCPYTPGAYAWWQVVTLGLGSANQDVVFVEPDSLDEWPEKAIEGGVNAVSGTPTFWRQSLMRHGASLAHLSLRQATLGGEPVDQSVLDLVAAAFPDARVSWIYASSEAGAAIAVHDGRAGFPLDWVDRHTPGRPVLSIDGDELVIASPMRGEGIAEFLHTGDRVQVQGDRVAILGRLATDEINVGGTKVSAGAVREVLLAHPGVAWAAVKGARAPLVGAVVQADVVLESDSVTETELARYCAQRLSPQAAPRRFRFLDSIPLKESLKSDV